MVGSARAHILEVAGTLFFQYGYRAVGVDTIIAESGVAKATLYRHFPSKDDLIAAYLEAANTRFWEWFEAGTAPHPDDPRGALLQVFRNLEKLVTSPACWGCPFLIAATEFPERDHVAHRVAVAHKQAVRARLLAMCRQMGAKLPEALADQLYLTMDGAFMAVRTFGAENPAQGVAAAAERLIACLEY